MSHVIAVELADETELSRGEAVAIGTAMGLPSLFLFVPAVEDLIMWHDTTQLRLSLAIESQAGQRWARSLSSP